jgi:thiosulfate/3-mercaptopyruvate sulfurtransferase
VNGEFPVLVSTKWLASRLGRPHLRAVDGSWYLPTSERDPAAEHAAGHIPGAIFFDLDASSDSASPLPHMLPRPQAFAERMSGLGLDDDDDLVIYDGSGANASAARVWWMFRVFGHPRVTLLDGGLGKWKAEGRPLEAGPVRPPPARFTARLDRSAVRSLEDLRVVLANGAEQVVDMRSAGRFAATEAEPRPGLRGGHIPGSRNLPFTELVTPDGTLLPQPELERRIAAAGVHPDRPIIATCGSGTSACTLIHALHLLGRTGVSLYDGAWTEWGGRSDTPVATGGSR